MVCVFNQGSAHSECQCISHSAADHVQPGGEDLWAAHREWNHCSLLVWTPTFVFKKMNLHLRYISIGRLYKVWSKMLHLPLSRKYLREKRKSLRVVKEQNRTWKIQMLCNTLISSMSAFQTLHQEMSNDFMFASFLSKLLWTTHSVVLGPVKKRGNFTPLSVSRKLFPQVQFNHRIKCGTFLDCYESCQPNWLVL